MTSDRGTSGGAELDLNKPVTPKSPGLNPNASVFCVKSTPGTTDTGQWDPQANDSGIANSTSSVSDYSYLNGDVSQVDKSVDGGVFSPTPESSFQPEFTPFTDNQVFNEPNANVGQKLEENMGNLILDNAQAPGFPVEPPTQVQGQTQVNYGGGDNGGAVPMSGIQYSNDNTSTTDGEPAVATDSSIPDDQVRQMLKNQLETYFSREKLAGDSYLQSQMDSDQYVPIATVANLDQIQRLTSDLPLIVEVLRESNFVQVDEKGEKVRPNTNRCIVILREIPDETPVEDVQALFSGVNCPKFVSCEFAHNSNWYVTFDSDADAQRAYQYLREEVCTFLGKPIMARIKAKPLIRTYPSNGYPVNKRFQQQQQNAPIISETVTASSSAPQYTANQPFTLMPNMSQYHLNGQQAIPFYPPPSPLMPSWPTANPTMLDPSMVLAINGYQATNVKVNNPVSNRNMFTNMNRNNSRNQKPQHNQPMNRDRINSNESLPPRLQNQQDRQQQQQQQQQQHHHNNNHSNGNIHMHKTSPRNMDNNNISISNHAPPYQNRRLGGNDGSGGNGHGSHGNNHINHSHNHSGGHHGNHMSHGGGGPHSNHPHSHAPPHMGGPGGHQGGPMSHHQHQQHIENSANNNNNMNSRMQPPSERFAVKSYKSRRRRDGETDGATRPNRSTSSQQPPREGGPPGQEKSRMLPHEKFDYEPTSFPPLPGSGNNTTSGEVFESKLSDVVKGTAKPFVKETTKPSSGSTITTPTPAIPPATPTTTTAASTVKIPATPPVISKENKENIAVNFSSTVPSGTSASPSPPTTSCSDGLREPVHTKTTSSPALSQQSVSNIVRPTAKPKVEAVVPDTKSSDNPLVQTQSNSDDNASLSRLSYAQMVQRSKAAEASANSLAEGSDSDGVGGDENGAPLQQSNRVNHTLKEQGQQSAQPHGNGGGKPSSTGRGPSKDFNRRDGRDYDRFNRDRDSDCRRGDNDRREDFRKDNDYRRDEPREQRFSSGRRLKENRDRRFGGDRDVGRRMDRRDLDGPKERDGPRTAVAK